MAKTVTSKQTDDFYFELEYEIMLFQSRYPNINPFAHFGLNTEIKESEGNKMIHKVTITKLEQKTLEEYWCMRVIKLKSLSSTKTVIKEKECDKEPDLEEIATFLAESGGDFVSVVKNYRFEDELPFD